MPVSIRIRNVTTLIEGSLSVEVRDEIRKTLSYIIPGYKFTPAYKYAVQAGRKWDGSKTVALLNKGGVPGLTIPTGLASYAREILAAKGVPYEISDERLVTVPDPGWSTSGLIMRDYQLPIVESALKRQRGVIKSSTGCHEAGQGILMHDGSTKLVEDIIVGDKLMGPDSLPRVVQSLIRGRGQMYKINPVKGKPFVVNDTHVLSLSITCGRSYRVHSKTNQVGRRRPPQQFVDVPLNEWLTWKPHLKHVYKLYRVPTSWGKKHLPIKPYVLGALIGDGSLLHTVSLCSMDKEIASEFKKESERLGMKCDEYHNNNSVNKSSMYYARVIVKGSKNTFKEILRKIGLFDKTSGDKFIPFDYKTSDQSDRLEVLAGLMDTDGTLSNGVYDFVSKSRQLADDVAFVARSVGLAAYVKPTYKYCQTGMGGEYFRVIISGHTSIIPCRIPRKKGSTRKQKKNVLRTGFSAEKIGLGDFFGFTVNGDGRYLLDDFTVTHNSGKTEVVVKIMVEVACFPAIFYVTSCDLLLQAKDRFSRYVTYNGLPAKIGQIGAGVCDIQPITIATVQSCERVLTGKYTKYTYDDYSSDDKTEFSDPQKNAIREMVKDAKFVVFDECQHCSCETIQSILNESHSARFRFGCSASPWRDDGLDLLIEACFGRRVCDVTASFLINSGYLLKPFITFNHFNQSLGDFGTFNAHYEAFVSDNVARNQWIAERTNYHVSLGRPTIVLVKWVKHAEKLQPMIPGSEILCSSGDSKKSPKKRKEFMDAMRERKLMCIIGTSLMDEGVDVPAAGAGIFAGGGKSSTRELQRVGRFIRPDPADPDKKCAYIEEFYDHSKWLRNHAKLRRKILETESAFEISDNNISLSL